MTGRFDTELLPEGLRATGYSAHGAILAIDAEVIDAKVICPGCGQRSSRRHGCYVRNRKDFPAHGRAVQVRLSVQRCRCVEASKVSLISPVLIRVKNPDSRRHRACLYCATTVGDAADPGCDLVSYRFPKTVQHNPPEVP